MLDWNALPAHVNADPEFRLSARLWDATMRLDVGASSHALRFEDGELTDISPSTPDAACDLFISAPEADWRELLAEFPRPFYQDLSGAAIFHDVRLPQDMTSYAAYYPALRRLIQLMSALSRKEAA